MRATLALLAAALLGAVVGAGITVGVVVAVDDDGNSGTAASAVTADAPTPTPCENFYQASAFLAGAATSDTAVSAFLVLDDGRPDTLRQGQLQQLFDKCVQYAWSMN